MSKIRSLAIILGIIVVTLPSAARAQATPTEIKLLTQNTGWALIQGRLYWTNDFGQDWRDITPTGVAPRGPATIADVFFLDTSNGSVLLRRSTPSGPYGDWSFDLASTDDGGITWSVSPVNIPGWDIHRDNMFSGNGTVDFLDPSHGWADLSLQSSSAFRLGALFVTTDGGRTWDRVPAPVGFGRVGFLSAQVGWVAGGPDDDSLVVTRDGGKTWTRTVIDAPPQLRPAPLAAYHLPIFTDYVHGVVEVSYPHGGPVALFATHDGGRTWTPTIAVPYQQMAGATATAVLGSELITGEISERTALVLTTFGAGARSRRVTGTIRPSPGIASRLDFVSARAGWVLAGGRLYSTLNGGAAWTDATPGPSGSTGPAGTRGAGGGAVQPAAPVPVASDVASPQITYTATGAGAGGGERGGGGAVGSLHTSIHLGFDSCTAPLPTSMATWWAQSPYYDYGFYLGGTNTHCALYDQCGSGTGNPSLTPTQWISDIVTQRDLEGWVTLDSRGIQGSGGRSHAARISG